MIPNSLKAWGLAMGQIAADGLSIYVGLILSPSGLSWMKEESNLK